jgi:PUA domain protein
MAELRFRKRRRLKHREIEDLAGQLEGAIGAPTFTTADTVDRAEGPDFDVVYVNGPIMAFVLSGEVFPTVRGLLKWPAKRQWVTVDMGAVKFIYNGADVMAPGIVDADPGIQEGQLVWVRDERNLRPLAVGRALMAGGTMRVEEKGKAVKSVHHVGDDLWKVDEEPR